MAKRASRSAVRYLTRAELILGWCYLPVYLVALNVLLTYLNRRFSLGLDLLGINCIYFAVNFLAVLLIFRRFLRQPFFGSRFWDFVQALILGFVLHWAATQLLSLLLTRLVPDFTIYNNKTVTGLVSQNRWVMLAISLVLAPVIEETLVRGLVFGSLREGSRVMAYLVSAVLFTLMHNWQYLGVYPLRSVLFSCIPYLPASAALAWTYEKSGTIWCAVTLHALINAMSFGLIPLP